jgi:hypothetical protein
MSFETVFTASAMGFALLVPLLMVAVLLVYGGPEAQRRTAAKVRTEVRRAQATGRTEITRRVA